MGAIFFNFLFPYLFLLFVAFSTVTRTCRLDTTVRFTKSGSVLPLYKIGALLKTGDAGVFIITRKINIVIKALFEGFDR